MIDRMCATWARMPRLFAKPLVVVSGVNGAATPPPKWFRRRWSSHRQPNPARVCTSHIERENLTRLTNGFSKKCQNLWAALCLHFAHCNFCRIHRTLRVTPAMESGITDHVWTIAELLA